MKFKILLIFFFIPIIHYSQEQKYTNEWISLGPTCKNLSVKYQHVGRITAVWVNPTDTSEILIGTPTAGLWRTQNGGENWNCLTENILCGVNDIYVPKNNLDEIFIATGITVNGLLQAGYYGNGILKSSDRGNSWKILDMDIEPADLIFIEKIQPDLQDSSIIYAVAKTTVYKSKDYGKSWKKLDIDCKGDWQECFTDITIKKSNTKHIVVSGRNVLYRTFDGGKKWENIYSEFCECTTRITAVYGSNDTLYAMSMDSKSSQNLIRKSIDDGLNWIDKKHFLYGKKYVLSFWNISDSIFYSGGIYFYKSINYCNNFNSVHKKLHADIRDICVPIEQNPDLVYVTTDGEIAKSEDGGKTWKNISGDLSISQSYSIGICQTDINYLITGSHDNGTYYYDTTNIWQHIYGGDGGTTLFNSQNPDICFFTYNSSSGIISLKRRENKKTSKILMSSILNYDFPVIQSLKNPNIIYAAGFKWHIDSIGDIVGTVLKSEDNGLTFSSEDEPWAYSFGVISAMEMCEEQPENFYFSSYDHWKKEYGYLKKTNDAGKTWEIVNSEFLSPLISKTKITDIEVHPENPEKLWISFTGFYEDSKVFYSENGGDEWINMTYNLENYPVNEIEYYKKYDLLLIGTNTGIYYFDNVNQEWKNFGSKLPKILISDLKINFITEEVYFASYGRGIWKTQLKEEQD